MLLTVTGLLAGLLVLLWRWGGAVRALLIAWLICLAPTALGLVRYDYLEFAGNFYLWVILVSILVFLAGAALANAQNTQGRVAVPVDFTADYRNWRTIGGVCLLIATISVVTTVINIVSSGIDFSNLSDLRADVIDMTEANIWARIAAVTGWACFLCLGLSIYFRSEMGFARASGYLAAGSGVFISMLTLAGRNSVLQLMIFCLVIEAIRRSRLRMSGASESAGISSRWAIVGAGTVYMLYITLNRPGDMGAADRSEVLFRLFNANIGEGFDAVLNYIPVLKGPIVEFILYMTHTAPLFSIYTTIDFGGHFYGIFSFPFIARQLEPIFGHNVADALNLKRFYVQSAGVIGFGWTTALSSFIMDFGYAGCAVVMLVQGYVSQLLFNIVRRGAHFGFVLMYVLMIIAAAFTPFLPAFSDTNLFILMVALLVVAYILRGRSIVPSSTVD